MKDLITVRIIHALNEQQEKLISIALKQEKRQSLLQLFKWLINTKNDVEISKSEIFLKLFKKKWTKENDFLLRNELKLLKDKIEEIYIQEETKELPENYINQLKLKLYHQLKITDEYQSIFKKISNYNTEHNEIYFSASRFVRFGKLFWLTNSSTSS